ncbi:MAG: hypothetical protein IT257_06045 [Chitinophagaceae bacterium]|nr:hypothetical protein [Chitinophagaceae bacterium]
MIKEEHDYLTDITAIRSMMERSSKFLALSGQAAVMAGIYALAGSLIAWKILKLHPESMMQNMGASASGTAEMNGLVMTALLMLLLAAGTAIILSFRNAQKRGEKLWSPVSRRLLSSMALPLISGGLLMIIFFVNGLPAYSFALSLIFYGFSMCNASRFTFPELNLLGIMLIALGLLSACLLSYALLIWALGFGVLHIVYGLYIHFRYKQ